MTKFSTSAFVHPVFTEYSYSGVRLSISGHKLLARVSDETRRGATKGRRRTQRRTIDEMVFASSRALFANSKNGTPPCFQIQNPILIPFQKGKEKKKKRKKKTTKTTTTTTTNAPGDGVKFHKLRASPTFGPCSAMMSVRITFCSLDSLTPLSKIDFCVVYLYTRKEKKSFFVWWGPFSLKIFKKKKEEKKTRRSEPLKLRHQKLFSYEQKKREFLCSRAPH